MPHVAFTPWLRAGLLAFTALTLPAAQAAEYCQPGESGAACRARLMQSVVSYGKGCSQSSCGVGPSPVNPKMRLILPPAERQALILGLAVLVRDQQVTPQELAQAQKQLDALAASK